MVPDLGVAKTVVRNLLADWNFLSKPFQMSYPGGVHFNPCHERRELQVDIVR